MTYNKRQRLSIIFLSLFLLLIVIGVILIGIMFYEDGQAYIEIVFSEDHSEKFDTNRYEFTILQNGTIIIYDTIEDKQLANLSSDNYARIILKRNKNILFGK